MPWSDRSHDDVTDVHGHSVAREARASGAEPQEAPRLHRGGAMGAPLPATFSFMQRHPAHWIALGFGSGLSPLAPGTAGTLFAWVAWLLLSRWMTPFELSWILGASFPVGWWAATVTARHLNNPDPGAIVVDEVVAFWLVLWLLLPAGWWAQLAAFALFRVFDAVKRGPVGWADRLFHNTGGWRGGFGIMLDDLVAAGCTLLVIALARVLL